jgi:hypothetical protein
VVKRMPISKQRNKHLQSVLVEAAKLGPRLSPDRGRYSADDSCCRPTERHRAL